VLHAAISAAKTELYASSFAALDGLLSDEPGSVIVSQLDRRASLEASNFGLFPGEENI
jgi:hypothetical protein